MFKTIDTKIVTVVQKHPRTHLLIEVVLLALVCLLSGVLYYQYSHKPITTLTKEEKAKSREVSKMNDVVRVSGSAQEKADQELVILKRLQQK